ncbi:relaxase/mobilization nuclease domain-containing protein [Caenispirillum salinarum]|uniref:relaxase/mobilization nuclease domain-containing protein n=1 Tax=Caenispirillum salinarum TaxID=859058 RepID=UPI000A04AF71
MISKGVRGSSFAGVLRYVADQKDAEVVGEWNLGTENPHHAAALMKLTANASRCERPVYHVSMRPDPRDRALSNEEWLQICGMMMKSLGLEHHQCFAVLHGAGSQRHAHAIFNRVNGGKAAPLRHDYAQRERTMRQIEHVFRLRPVEGRFYDAVGRDRRPAERTARVQGLEPPERPRHSKTTGEVRCERRAGRSSRAHRIVSTVAKASAGGAFISAIAEEDLVLCRGQKSGFVVFDTRSGRSVSLSRILSRDARDQVLPGIDRNALPAARRAAFWLASHRSSQERVEQPVRNLEAELARRSVKRASVEQHQAHSQNIVSEATQWASAAQSGAPLVAASERRHLRTARTAVTLRANLPVVANGYLARLHEQMATLLAEYATERSFTLRISLLTRIEEKERQIALERERVGQSSSAGADSRDTSRAGFRARTR